jgi:uncharacterized repeat protein (TIGR04138 family)
MTKQPHPLRELIEQDQRFTLDAYQFVREALAYAQEVLRMPKQGEDEEEPKAEEHHLTGQQLCEAIRLYALEQFGYMSKTVLNSWGIHTTGDFGEIVYNLIRIKQMKKSKADKREDFDDVYQFEEAFQPVFEITPDT